MENKSEKIIKVLDAGVIEHKRTFVCFRHASMGEVDSFLFRFYDDELSFVPDELVGKTEDQAFDLFCQRDRDYLRS